MGETETRLINQKSDAREDSHTVLEQCCNISVNKGILYCKENMSQAIQLLNIFYPITFRQPIPSVSHLNHLFSSPQAQRKELFIQERYGRYNLSDPFLALQRDSEAMGGQNKDPGCSSSTSNPLVVLKLVVSHCRRMQEKMLAQLAAAESRHRRVGLDVWS